MHLACIAQRGRTMPFKPPINDCRRIRALNCSKTRSILSETAWKGAQSPFFWAGGLSETRPILPESTWKWAPSPQLWAGGLPVGLRRPSRNPCRMRSTPRACVAMRAARAYGLRDLFHYLYHRYCDENVCRILDNSGSKLPWYVLHMVFEYSTTSTRPVYLRY